MNDRFNIKNGVTENLLNHLQEKCNKKKHSNKSVQSFYKIAILKNFAKFTRKSLVLMNFQAFSLQLYLTRDSSRCFPVKFAKFSIISFQ